MSFRLPRRLLPTFMELMAFEAAARLGSFSRAAEALSLTQGAISKQIRQLEQTLGVDLFVRSKRQVALTDSGRAYLRDARDILERLEQSTYAVVAAGGSTSVLNIAVLPTFATRWLLPRLPSFVAQYPELKINFSTRLQPFDFDTENFDAAIHHGPPHWPGTTITPLLEDELVPVASAAYCKQMQLSSPKDLRRAVLLQQATRPGIWADWFASCDVPFEPSYRGPLFDQFSMTLQAAIAGLGVALVPRFFLDEEVRSKKLLIVVDRPLRSEEGYHLAVPLTKQQQPIIAAFRDWIVSQTQKSESGLN